MSKRTTRVLLAGFAILLLLSSIGLFSQMAAFSSTLDPRKEHVSHLLTLGPGETGEVSLHADSYYSAYVQDGAQLDGELRMINISSLEPVPPEAEAEAIPGGLQGKDGAVFTSKVTWIPQEDADVVLYNDANTTIWLVDETAVLQTIIENEVMVASLFGCLASLCLIPVIILWFLVSRPGQNDIAIKLATAQGQSGVPQFGSGDRMPTTDELYRAVHGSEEQRMEVYEALSRPDPTMPVDEVSDVPAPFADRPDRPFTQPQGTHVPLAVKSEPPAATEFPKTEKTKEWKNWDDG